MPKGRTITCRKCGKKHRSTSGIRNPTRCSSCGYDFYIYVPPVPKPGRNVCWQCGGPLRMKKDPGPMPPYQHSKTHYRIRYLKECVTYPEHDVRAGSDED